MITVRRSEERAHVKDLEHETWHTFGLGTAVSKGGFGVLEQLDEDAVAPCASTTFSLDDDAEIVTYLFEGSVVRTDAPGTSEILHAGEFQTMIVGRRDRPRETNPSPFEWMHRFRVSLRGADIASSPNAERKRFSVADRRGCLCVIASLDGRQRSLRLTRDAVVYSSVLDSGQHVVLPLSATRRAWLHVVCGQATTAGLTLGAGDGASFEGERALSVTAGRRTELLVVEVPNEETTSAW